MDDILTADEQRFVQFYMHPDIRDPKLVAQKMGTSVATARKMFKIERVQRNIQSRLQLIADESSKQIATREVLALTFLDENLAEIVGCKEPKMVTARLDALRLGYVVRGKITTREMQHVAGKDDQGVATGPSFYRAFEEGHTVTRRGIESGQSGVIDGELVEEPVVPTVFEY